MRGAAKNADGANDMLAVQWEAAVISEWIDCEELKSVAARLLMALCVSE